MIKKKKKWDLRWQHVYRLVSPQALPNGTMILMHYTYDISVANLCYPQQPPIRVFCFFFSSRRRHTSSLRDWSSDVCSSDLDGILGRGRIEARDAGVVDERV